MIYISETWAIRKKEEVLLLRVERAMVRLMYGVKLRDRKRTSELISMLGLYDDIVTLMGQSLLNRHSVETKNEPESKQTLPVRSDLVSNLLNKRSQYLTCRAVVLSWR